MTETEAKWAERVRQWRDSGLKAEPFAEGKGFQGSTVRWWASRLRKLESRAGDAAAAQTMTGHEVETSPIGMLRVRTKGRFHKSPTAVGAAALTITIGAARIEIQTGFDVALLREVVEALGGAP
jgi:hypothetical protein